MADGEVLAPPPVSRPESVADRPNAGIAAFAQIARAI